MAAITPTQTVRTIMGNKRVHMFLIPAFNTGDTLDTLLSVLDSVQMTQFDAGAANAADKASISSISGGVVTMSVAGTSRGQYVTAIGR